MGKIKIMADATFLERIVVATRARLAERQAEKSLEQLYDEARQQPPALDFAAALRPSDGGIRIIGEIKRASPSKGPLNLKLHPRDSAGDYARAGAAAISVLTEQDFFQGSLDDLREAKRSKFVANIPFLRKDFITDPYQVVEARAAGADSFLLIVALLDNNTLESLLQLGRELGMEALVEAHDTEEALRAVKVGAKVIGVNARDLRTFEVDTTRLRDIRPLIPDDVVVVAESGIASRLDVIRMRGYGAQAILVGEALVRGNGHGIFHSLTKVVCMTRPKPTSIVKLCGMRTPADALAAYEAGADLIGLVFAPSKRQVTPDIARDIIAALPQDALTVGIFTDDPVDAVEDLAGEIGLKAVQVAIHLDRVDITRTIRMPAIVSIPSKGYGGRTRYAPVGYKQLPLIDSAPPGVWGGTGAVGDWNVAAKWAKEFPIILAGGLNPENVGDAIRAVQPWGVDVSSGIEGPDGQKDPARMRAFVQAVREASERTQHEGPIP
jgi:indole-3-glycerol phosphate synthase / phosphoribosylanthranilate isomerase